MGIINRPRGYYEIRPSLTYFTELTLCTIRNISHRLLIYLLIINLTLLSDSSRHLLAYPRSYSRPDTSARPAPACTDKRVRLHGLIPSLLSRRCHHRVYKSTMPRLQKSQGIHVSVSQTPYSFHKQYTGSLLCTKNIIYVDVWEELDVSLEVRRVFNMLLVTGQ